MYGRSAVFTCMAYNLENDIKISDYILLNVLGAHGNYLKEPCSTELFLRVNYLKKKPKQTKNVILRTSLKANKKENLYTMTFFQSQEL